MRKNKVLTIVPNIKQFRKDLKNKQRELGRLNKEVQDLEFTLNDVEGITIFNEFPVMVLDVNDTSFEVLSGCDDTSRYAVVTETDNGKWSVVAYKSEDAADGQQIASGLTKVNASRTAKEFVSSGKTGLKGKVGRPRKNSLPLA